MLLSALFILASTTQGQVLTVDDDGGADHVAIADAVAASSDGDTILVRSGSYAGFTLTDRSLTIAADAGADVACGPVVIDGQLPGQSLVLLGLEITGTNDGVGTTQEGLIVDGCAGTVHIEDCVVRGPVVFPFSSPQPRPALRVDSSAAVTIVGCVLEGPLPDPSAPAPSADAGPGLLAISSAVHLLDSDVFGGKSGAVSCSGGEPASGAGIEATGGFVFIDGCTVTGGDGAYGVTCGAPPFVACTDGADGAPGIQASSAQIVQRDTVLTGGSGGDGGVYNPLGSGCNGNAGADAPALSTSNSAVQALSGSARTLDLSLNPAREGETTTLGFGGEPGDLVAFGFSPAPLGFYLPGLGVLVPGTPLVVLTIGVLDASGATSIDLTLSPFAGADALQLYLQGVMVSTTGEIVLSSARTLVMLDGSL